jgi:hypothetical protein
LEEKERFGHEDSRGQLALLSPWDRWSPQATHESEVSNNQSGNAIELDKATEKTNPTQPSCHWFVID